tara:strand:+ start:71 stop:709 length:639 start_codon:yes stop_codon:yes gene_type:complete
MTSNIDIKVFRPFGPAIGEISVKQKFIDDLNDYSNSIINNEDKSSKFDAGKQLAGQVKQEFEIENNFFDLKIKDYLNELVRDYVWNSFEKKIIDYEEFKKRFQVRYKSKWIVRQFENEYNPLHSHTGNISGVCYLLLPNDFGSKSQDSKRSNPNGCIALAHGSEQFMSPAIKLIKPTLAKFIFFPNYLLHTVYPFKGKGERRSFSFNADIGF